MLTDLDIPECLQQIPSPPKQLFCRGKPLQELLQYPRVAIVGSRSISPYGEEVTYKLAYDLAQQGIVIISGLALGVDAVAHRAALDAGGNTIAVLASSVDEISPPSNYALGERILRHHGAIISEYAPGTTVQKQNFVARNRLVAGLATIVLITEAAEKSGSLHTARFALEQGKDVLAIPGNITSSTSVGTLNLLKSGATVVTDHSDVLHVLGLKNHPRAPKEVRGRNPSEQKVLELLVEGISEGEELQKQSQLSVSEFNQTLTMLEISSLISPLGNNRWTIR